MLKGRFWGDLRSLAVPVLTYWAAIALSFATFFVAIVLTQGPDGGTLIVLAILAGSTVLGVVYGQVCALLRLRTWAVLVAGSIGAGILFALTMAASVVPEVAILIGVVLFLFPFFGLSGWWSLQVNGAMLSTFAPIVFFVGTVITVAEASGSADRWFAGQKWAIWDVFTLPVLLVGVLSVLAFLASREIHRLHHWQNLGAEELVKTQRKSGSIAGALVRSLGTLAVIGSLGVALTLGSALLAPYLWRTGPADDGNGRSHEQPDPQPQPQPQPPRPHGKRGQPRPDPQSPQKGPASPMTPEEMKQAAKKAGISVLFLLLFAVLALLAFLVFGPPFRRTLLLQHLRRPLWPVPPSRHVQQSWWLVEVALGDLEVERNPGDTAAVLAVRAVRALPGALEVGPLLQVAEVSDRVAYGLGIAPDDTMRARRMAEMAYEAVWSQLGEMQKIKAMYRWI